MDKKNDTLKNQSFEMKINNTRHYNGIFARFHVNGSSKDIKALFN